MRIRRDRGIEESLLEEKKVNDNESNISLLLTFTYILQ